MTDRVQQTAEQYKEFGVNISRRDMPIVHRAILAEICRLTELFADAFEAKDAIRVMEIADKVSRLRTILADSFRPA